MESVKDLFTLPTDVDGWQERYYHYTEEEQLCAMAGSISPESLPQADEGVSS